MPTTLTHPRAEKLDRLLREVQIAERIQPAEAVHLLGAIDYAYDETTLFLVMPRADRTLADSIGPAMSEVERLQAIRDVATGLMELHSIPIVHRDLKPGNVLFRDGRWMLADFGIARDLDASTATLTFAGFGTARYMAPELFRPPFAATPKSDLYALGCIGYELWSGTPPFSAEDGVELARLHREAEVPLLPESVNLVVRRVVMRLLDKDPSGRPQDARAVAEELGRAVLGPVSPEARRLQALAGQHHVERSAESAAASAAQAEAQAHQHEVKQALSDLRATLQAGTDLVNEALPDVEFSQTGNQFSLRGEEASLHLGIWPEAKSSLWVRGVASPIQGVARENHLLYGQVDGENWRMRDEPPLANLVCEIEDGRSQWILYRYTRTSFGASQYPFGPENRRHGFSMQDFFSSNVYPYAFRDWGGAHIFQKTHQVLSAEGVGQLFAAALALPEDSDVNPA